MTIRALVRLVNDDSGQDLVDTRLLSGPHRRGGTLLFPVLAARWEVAYSAGNRRCRTHGSRARRRRRCVLNAYVVMHIAALFVASFACVFDLRTRRIPNWLTFGSAALASRVPVRRRRCEWCRTRISGMG